MPAIAKHLKNIFDSGELQEVSVVSILETTAAYISDFDREIKRLEGNNGETRGTRRKKF